MLDHWLGASALQAWSEQGLLLSNQQLHFSETIAAQHCVLHLILMLTSYS